MKIFAVTEVLPKVTEAQIAAHQKEEAAIGSKLAAAGFIREAYSRQDARGAVMVLESASVEEARRQINTLPLAREGLMEIELIPVRPVGST